MYVYRLSGQLISLLNVWSPFMVTLWFSKVNLFHKALLNLKCDTLALFLQHFQTAPSVLTQACVTLWATFNANKNVNHRDETKTQLTCLLFQQVQETVFTGVRPPTVLNYVLELRCQEGLLRGSGVRGVSNVSWLTLAAEADGVDTFRW